MSGKNWIYRCLLGKCPYCKQQVQFGLREQLCNRAQSGYSSTQH